MKANNRSKQLGKPRKTTKKTAIALPNGRGALLPGGQYGNKGGGRRPDEVRELATQLSYDEIIPKLKELINDKETPPKTVVSACTAILGLVPRKDEGALTSEQVKGLCQAYSATVMQIVAEETPDAFLRIQARMEEQLARVGV